MSLKTWIAGEKVLADDLNNNFGLFTGSFQPNAGETINGATLPVPVYQLPADSEVYACDANDTTKLRFIGFATTNSTNGNPITVVTQGVLAGFSGLTPGTKYYVQDAVGTIGVTPGTYEIFVGIAISATQILIQKGARKTSGTTSRAGNTASGSQTIAHNLGSRPKKVRITAKWMIDVANGSMSESVGTYSGSITSTLFSTSDPTNAIAGVDTTNIIRLQEDQDGDPGQVATISVDDTNITLTWTRTGSSTSSDMYIMWEAETD